MIPNLTPIAAVIGSIPFGVVVAVVLADWRRDRRRKRTPPIH